MSTYGIWYVDKCDDAFISLTLPVEKFIYTCLNQQ